MPRPLSVVESKRLPEWEAHFQQPASAWRGADAAYSVAISPRQTLWLFGDSWIDISGKPARDGCTMITNSIAIQSTNEDPPTTPTLHWGRNPTGEPWAFFRQKPEFGKGRLWPLSGLRLGPRLYLFFNHVVETHEGIGAKSVRSVLATVANPDDEPALWRIEQTEVPFFRHTRHGDLIFGGGSISLDGFVYVLGVRENWRRGPTGRDQILARVPEERFVARDFGSWRFWTGEDWAPEVKGAAALFDGTASEYSISFLPDLEQYVIVYTRIGSSPEILGRFAERPEGPWSEPVVLHVGSDNPWSEKNFYYAGKAHPEFARGGNELILTYATNSWDIGEVTRDLRLYWPRFVRVMLQEAAPPRAQEE